VFDFAKDYLGLLKAAVIASGIVPPGIEGSGQSLADLLARRRPRPRPGTRQQRQQHPQRLALAVSTNLLAALIASACAPPARPLAHRPLEENERRIVLARAMLGEWLGGSGGGWQDSGGVWPGMKLICGASPTRATRARHQPRPPDAHPPHPRPRRCRPGRSAPPLQDSLVLVHGGMAQNVGPILEMVTEKYLLRSEPEWRARASRGMACSTAFWRRCSKRRRRPAIGAATTAQFRRPDPDDHPLGHQPLHRDAHRPVRAEFGEDFWGFWMLGGMSGGGMGFMFAPERKADGQEFLQKLMSETKTRARLRAALRHGAGGL
jgi:hypothetical protein